ncbi:MAG: hypothetical protein ABSH36_13330 [Solirubrobacteraceae bacterium]
MADAQAGDQRLGVLAALTDAGLLVVEQVAADAILVVHVQELALLLFDFLKNGLAALDLQLGGGDLLVEVFGDRLADLLAFLGAELDGRVVRVDLGFYDIDGVVALRALPALVLGTDEVLVDTAVAIVAGVDELAAAGAATDGALEVVLVLAVALPGMAVRNEHGLDLVE